MKNIEVTEKGEQLVFNIPNAITLCTLFLAPIATKFLETRQLANNPNLPIYVFAEAVKRFGKCEEKRIRLNEHEKSFGLLTCTYIDSMALLFNDHEFAEIAFNIAQSKQVDKELYNELIPKMRKLMQEHLKNND